MFIFKIRITLLDIFVYLNRIFRILENKIKNIIIYRKNLQKFTNYICTANGVLYYTTKINSKIQNIQTLENKHFRSIQMSQITGMFPYRSIIQKKLFY